MTSVRSPLFLILVALVIVSSSVVSCRARRGGTAEELVVFAAASLTDALQEIGSEYAASGTEIVFNFAGTNTLRDQIEHGAEADLFISANPEHMDAVEAGGFTIPGSRVDLLANRLVLVARDDSLDGATFPEDLADATKVARIAIAEPDIVPAGIYGKAALVRLGLWEAVAPRIVPALDVRAVLAYVVSGNADVGIVYATDAAIGRKARVVYEFPATAHPPIRYPAAILRTTRDEAAARRFLDFLQSSKARAIFARYGFTIDFEREDASGGN